MSLPVVAVPVPPLKHNGYFCDRQTLHPGIGPLIRRLAAVLSRALRLSAERGAAGRARHLVRQLSLALALSRLHADRRRPDDMLG